MPQLKQAKGIVKSHKINGFKKLRLKSEMYIIGRQCERIDTPTALSLLSALEGIGYQISQKEITLELARKGLLDTVTLYAPVRRI